MKKDAAAEHRKHAAELQAKFLKKSQYHQQKAYLELKDVYWLMHEFFQALLNKDQHFTEEELVTELQQFKHDYITFSPELLQQWQKFFHTLSENQYSGAERTQDEMKQLLREFSSLVELTLGKPEPGDSFYGKLQTCLVLAEHGDAQKAEQEYRSVVAEYNTLSDQKKSQYYPHIQKIYSTLASRRATP